MFKINVSIAYELTIITSNVYFVTRIPMMFPYVIVEYTRNSCFINTLSTFNYLKRRTSIGIFSTYINNSLWSPLTTFSSLLLLFIDLELLFVFRVDKSFNASKAYRRIRFLSSNNFFSLTILPYFSSVAILSATNSLSQPSLRLGRRGNQLEHPPHPPHPTPPQTLPS